MRQGVISYFADIVICPLLALALSLFAFDRYSKEIIEWLVILVLGVALWTLVEYFMHRVVYHHVELFRNYHEAHHANPQAYIGAPPLIGTSIVFGISFTPLLPVSAVAANGLSAGMLVGYSAYMLVHYACHSRQQTLATFLYRLRRRHAVHHYRDDGGNFGVTTAFWDRVFGTNIPTGGRPLKTHVNNSASSTAQ